MARRTVRSGFILTVVARRGPNSARHAHRMHTDRRCRPADYAFPDIIGSSISRGGMKMPDFIRLVYFNKR
ncbi:hypothetical protein A8E81_31955 [Burkholderia cenocepacia]|nr:hypothetical protein A8E75_16955 [Burkholderia cenocepacia]ONV24935.1 hypothetical protein A8E78_28395 [Burkholderia cenocepacia]ONV29443.1 hypothetical protein A8E77_22310 [Burkholderia cenocepacia]ONV36447.1 hypothetical protein A8E82_28795 [Burkholderia cenocepacia]ONV44215.1 hypothetical protein A8E81_31955 [Burkholderia cenocepacia]